MRQVAEVRTAVLAADGDAQQAQFTELGPQITRELVVLIYLGGPGGNPVGRESAYCCAQQVEVFAQAKIEFKHLSVPVKP